MSLLDCVRGSWSPGLGDPGVMGWVTVAVYLAAAGASGLAAARGRFPPRTAGRERTFWALAAALLLVLAVNKQLDLQSALTAAGRCLAQAQGWYERRRAVQIVFILWIALSGGAVLIVLVSALRGTLTRTGLALVGLGFVTLFVLMRAAGFHHVDALIGTRVVGARVNWILELFGPILVLAGAARRLGGRRRANQIRRTAMAGRPPNGQRAFGTGSRRQDE